MALGEMNSGNDIITDTGLTQEGMPADAKTVGDKFKSIKTDWNSVTDKPSTFQPSAHTHSYAGSSSAGGDATRALAVKDYAGSQTIEIGYASAGLTTSNLTHIAGYTDNGTKIKDVSKDVLKSWLGVTNPYPVGSIYMSTSSTSPASLFGGSQTQIQNQFLLAAGSGYSAGSTGGSTTHSHSYGIRYNAFYATFVGDDTTAIRTLTYNGTSETGYKDSIWVQDVSTKRNSGLSSGSTSTSSASYLNRATTSGNSNMPPYLAVYVWKRTA